MRESQRPDSAPGPAARGSAMAALPAAAVGLTMTAGLVLFYGPLVGLGTDVVLRATCLGLGWSCLFAAVARRRSARFVLTGGLWLWSVAWTMVLLHLRYFHAPPTLQTLRLLPQAPAVAGHALSLMTPALAAFATLAAATGAWYAGKGRGVPRAATTGIVGALLLAGSASRLLYDNLCRDIVGVAYDGIETFAGGIFYYSSGDAIARYGYVPFLFYHHRFTRRHVDYTRPLPNPAPPARATPVPAEPVRRPNVVILQVESLDAAVLDVNFAGRPVTPVLRTLAAHFLRAPNFFAQHALGGSSDAEVCALTGLLPLADGPLISFHQLNHLPSLPRLLHAYGYRTVACHGNTGRFWNRRNGYRQLGFETFVGGEQYHGNARGFHSLDAEFFAQTLPRLRQLHDAPAPFFAYLITQTMHGPYRDSPDVPANAHIHGPDSPGLHYLRKAAYTDAAIGAFLAAAADQGMAADTIFIIYGDHSSQVRSPLYSCGAAAGEQVPLLIRVPGGRPGVLPFFGSHLDIAPTVAALAGVPPDPRWLGRSMLSVQPDRLYPVAVTAPAYIKPGGLVPLSDALDWRYAAAVHYSRSYFYRLAPLPPPTPLETWRANHLVAHALGSMDGATYTNSISALQRSLAVGMRAFEVDLMLSADKRLICFHEGHEARVQLPPTRVRLPAAELIGRPLDGRFPLVPLEDVLAALAKQPGTWLVTDTKAAPEDCFAALAPLLRDHPRNAWPRVIPQIYTPAQLPAVRRILGALPVIFTLYRSGIDDDGVVGFVRTHPADIAAVAVSTRRFNRALAKRLRALRVPVYVHTLNDWAEMQRFTAAGAYGFYTDVLWP